MLSSTSSWLLSQHGRSQRGEGEDQDPGEDAGEGEQPKEDPDHAGQDQGPHVAKKDPAGGEGGGGQGKVAFFPFAKFVNVDLQCL